MEDCTPAGDVLAPVRAPLAAIQRRCKLSAAGLRFCWTSDVFKGDWLTIVWQAD